jgi:NAD/NADP transhydrogenase beta subunit
MEKQKLNPAVVYILSVLGFLCCCIGGIGFIPSGIAYFMANSQLNKAKADPENYEGMQGMNTAKIVALVVLIINVLYLLFTLYRIYTIGWDELMEQSQEMMDQWQQQNQ